MEARVAGERRSSRMGDTISAQLKQNFYATICPNVNVENVVRGVVRTKFQQTFVTVPATLRLFFHDCFVQGCDASVIIASTSNNQAEKDHPDNLSLAGDGFDTVIKAKAAVEATSCKNKVSCADILAMATRDVIALSGGPSYAVELGRLDGLSSTASSVEGKLPQPNFNLNQLNALFGANGLTQQDMIALSAAHTVGFSHCGKFSNRIYSFSAQNPVDPTLNPTYATQLQGMCPKNVDPSIAINMDPNTPNTFDNKYFTNLQQGKGLFTSDQVLFTDTRSKPTVDAWAKNSPAFQQAFVTAMTKLGRVGVKTGTNGNIRRDCGVFN
ncbi:putative Peroxidase 73 precursor [Tripterygium wilfordii]|uniref:Peroxidase n=1 Tax=Tripterygium wilfordii TaxID=458696 RepID=A0A7J7E308_TRIWF|nr:putative Peroxidase 73 precursor [Tripterygium wilfordii]